MSTLSITDMLVLPTAQISTGQESVPADSANAFIAVLDQQLGILLGSGLIGRGQDQTTNAGRADPLQHKPAPPPTLRGDEIPEILSGIPAETDLDTTVLTDMFAEVGPADVFGTPERLAPEDVPSLPAPESAKETDTEPGVAAAAVALALVPPIQPQMSEAIAEDSGSVDPDAMAKDAPFQETPEELVVPAADDRDDSAITKSSRPVDMTENDALERDALEKKLLKARSADSRMDDHTIMRDARAEQRRTALKGQSAPSTSDAGAIIMAYTAPRPSTQTAAFQPLSFAQAAQGQFPINAESNNEQPQGDSNQQGFSSFLASFDPDTHGKNTASAATATGNQSFMSYLTSARASFGAPPASEQVLMSIRQMAQQKQTELIVQLQPAELGRINVRLEFSEGGKVKARVAADRAETLDLLQSDRRGLEQALAAAGFDLDAGGMEFSLQQGNQQAFGDKASLGGSIAAGQDLPVDSSAPESDAAGTVQVDLSNGVVNVRI